MKFTTTLTSILKEVEKAATFAASKSANGMTSCIYLETEGDSLTVKATDNKAGFISHIEVVTNEPGSTTVYADKLLAILKNMPKMNLVFEVKDGVLHITPGGASKMNIGIKTLDASRFPDMLSKTGEGHSFSMKSSEIIQMASSVSFAVGVDTSRAFMTGVFMEAVEGSLFLVATDGRRLAASTSPLGLADFKGVVVPVRFFQALSGALDETVTITIDNGNVFAESGNVCISSATLGNLYPNWRKVIPQTTAHTLKVNVRQLEAAVNLTSVMTDSKTRSVFITAEGDQLMVAGQDANYGHSKQIIDCEYGDGAVVVQFNVTLLPPCLKGITTTNLIAKFDNGQKAWALYPEGEEGLVYVLMPMTNA